MKEKVFTILLCFFLFSACGDSGDEQMEVVEPEAVQDSIPTLSGQFIFLSENAILKGDNFIYGVAIDSISRDLAEKIKPYKTDNFDMVPITVKAKITENRSNVGYDEIIEIREVLEIPVQKEVSKEEAPEQ